MSILDLGHINKNKGKQKLTSSICSKLSFSQTRESPAGTRTPWPLALGKDGAVGGIYLECWKINKDVPVEPPRSHQGIIQDIGTVGGSQHYDMIGGSHSCRKTKKTKDEGFHHHILLCGAGHSVSHSCFPKPEGACSSHPLGQLRPSKCPLQLGAQDSKEPPKSLRPVSAHHRYSKIPFSFT